MTDDEKSHAPQTLTDRELRAIVVGSSLGAGICLGGMMALLMGMFGWEGKGPEWAGSGATGLIVDILHGFALGLGFAVALGLMVLWAKNRIKFVSVFLLAMILLAANTWLDNGWDGIIEIVCALPKGMIVFLPSMLLAIAVSLVCNCPARRGSSSKHLVAFLAFFALCVVDTWIRFGWETLLHALAIGIGLAVVVGLPTIILLRRYGPFDLSEKPST